jgi:uncharacterized membrane protein
MKERTLIYLVVVLVVINVAALGTIIYQRLADPDWGALRPKPMMETDPAMLKGLRLTPEQRDMMRESRRRVDSLLTPLHGQIRTKQQELYVEMDSDRPDTALINNLISEIGALEVAVQKTVIGNFLGDGRTLRPEQRRVLIKLIETRAKWQERPMFGPGQGFGRGRK